DQMVKTNEIKERYEAEKKEVQINLLQEKNKQLKWWYFSIFLLLALTSSLVWLRSYKRKINEEKILNYFATSLYNQNTVEDVFWDISKNCISRLNFEDCVVYSYDEARKMLVQKSAFGHKNPSGHSILQAIEIPLGRGIVGSVGQNMKAEIIPFTGKDPRYIVDDVARQSEICVPIVLEGKLLGVIDSEHSKKRVYTKRHLSILQKIADICSKKITRYFIEESLRKNIASDLHDDIGSSLSSIDINSRIALIKDDPGKMKEQLEKIRLQARKTMDSMSDIVWSLNPRYDNFENILIRMKQFSSELCEPQQINLIFQIPENLEGIKLAADKRKNIFLIFKETINNTVKYSKGNTLRVEFSFFNQYFKMTISDNGKGFDQQEVRMGNGLKNMADRAKHINANLKISSLPGNGTTLELSCPV
ncbi:MAG TPA: histidine kinase, partial [Ferruginibacter sp.]|nr:histidine kinase [Ferruginibacter sp.]